MWRPPDFDFDAQYWSNENGSSCRNPFLWLSFTSNCLPFDPTENQCPTDVQEESQTGAPDDFALHQNYPNPFNPSTTIKFSLPHSNYVSLKVFNMLGEVVATLVDEELNVGTYTTQWNASSVASGIYFYRLQAGEFAATKKLLLLK